MFDQVATDAPLMNSEQVWGQSTKLNRFINIGNGQSMASIQFAVK